MAISERDLTTQAAPLRIRRQYVVGSTHYYRYQRGRRDELVRAVLAEDGDMWVQRVLWPGDAMPRTHKVRMAGRIARWCPCQATRRCLHMDVAERHVAEMQESARNASVLRDVELAREYDDAASGLGHPSGAW